MSAIGSWLLIAGGVVNLLAVGTGLLFYRLAVSAARLDAVRIRDLVCIEEFFAAQQLRREACGRHHSMRCAATGTTE